ncbi:MAG: 50S ribosomal protein L24 [Myxococcaceae bacterium]
MQKLKVGDTVQVMAGAEASEKNASAKRGKIIRIDREGGRLSIEGIRMVKRHVKKGQQRETPEGGILEKPGTVAIASVALVCKKCDKATRVGIRADGEKKIRFCKACDASID